MTTTVLNTKNSEVENKIPDTGSLVTATALNTKISKVENELPILLFKNLNKLAGENFTVRLKQANLVRKTSKL